ncbi:alpha-mannosidase [Ktedonosporobacter rubrisoli]|uniref:alpha-mannosidase n=1 Tax=Ktedonosporobacter rubrisoli TaxID=2509675 RepID=A0A4P6JY43_KTERU|nr:glycoside hydrolase family 38 C-terminal domain-containing protein [Ktedonosporobacter rubrisoli]QBD80373.1 alpha-mannosidase [Ktedonosporobacter rubrisoli]
MLLTVEKLQMRIANLGDAAEGPAQPLEPVFIAPAAEPLSPPPAMESAEWHKLEVGQQWGREHATSWLMTSLELPEALRGKAVVLQLHWDTRSDDFAFHGLEATVLLDGVAVGGFDWRHLMLLLPETVHDGRKHTLAIQAYTIKPLLPFMGLSLHVRDELLWKLHYSMQAGLEVCLTLSEHAMERHALLEQLNTAYNMLDLREGWQSQRLRDSAHAAYAYLQKAIQESPVAALRPQVTISGHAHLDLAWLWPYWRTKQKIIHTVSNVLGLMERYPGYYYSQSQMQLFQWLKENDQEMYGRVRARVEEGRFEPVGAMWVEADSNLTSGESLIRQMLYGLRFQQEEFGATSRIVWLPDAFGYSAALPQIMRLCNVPAFVTTKMSWNQYNRMPYDTFRWQGIDGSQVLAHFVTAPDEHEGSYQHYTYNGPLHAKDISGLWTNYHQQDLNDKLLYLTGWGDGGGGPTEEQLERLQGMAQVSAFPEVSMGRANEYFTELYEHVWENPRLPKWVGELYLEYHRGTFTSQAQVKKSNRRMELFYRDIELLQTWANLYGMPLRQDRLAEGWRRIMLNQFHDVLPGSSINEVYKDAAVLYDEAQAIGKEVYTEALAVLRQRLGIADGAPVLLNTLPWERAEPVQLRVSDKAERVEGVQYTKGWDGETLALLDGVNLPSMGFAPLQIAQEAAGKGCYAVQGSDGTLALHNELYELVIDANGEIARLFDKRYQRDVLAQGQAGNQLVAFEDRPLHFDAWDIDLFYEQKAYPLREAQQIRLIEEGPVRVTVEIVRNFLSSRVTQRISLWRGFPRIDFATEIDWHEHQILLKTAFPLAINSTRATYEIQFGNVERPTHRNTSWDAARFEVCAHKWADLSEGNYGVSLLNDCKYGHDIHDNVMRLTLLKSAVSPDEHADQGLQRFTYSLLPHEGDWRTGQTVQRAYELNVPVQKLGEGLASSATAQGELNSFLRTDCAHVVVETVKPAEDGDGLIVRLYEAYNQRGQGTITFMAPIASACECNALEEELGEAQVQGDALHFQVRPFEIKTFRVRLAR